MCFFAHGSAIVILIVERYANAEPCCGCFDQSDANSWVNFLMQSFCVSLPLLATHVVNHFNSGIDILEPPNLHKQQAREFE